MEIKITQQDFLEGLSKTLSVVERKSTRPILSNILLEADKLGLKLTASDLEVTLCLIVPAQVIKPGKITVPSRSIHDIIRALSADEIHLTLKDNDRIELKAGNSEFVIPGLNASEFPKLPEVKVDEVEFECEEFYELLRKTSFSMSTDETRHNLAGILIESNDQGFKAVSTDGHRLSVVNKSITHQGLGDIKVIVPKKGVSELKKMLSNSGSFQLSIDQKNLKAVKGNETLYVRLIDGEFPDYTRVIPDNNNKIAILPRAEFMGALKRVSLLANEKSKGVVLKFMSGMLEVSINNPDLGEAKEELPIEYSEDRLSIGFNAKYFLEALDVLTDDSAVIALQTDLTPCLIKSEKDQGFLSVIMPMRI
jgi:DNA polymerase-3 subunit beta